MFRIVRAQHGITTNKRASKVSRTTQLRIPPAMWYPDVSFLHGILHRDFGRDMPCLSFKPHPVTIRDHLPICICRVHENLWCRHPLAQRLNLTLPCLKEGIFPHTCKYIIRIGFTHTRTFPIVRQWVKTKIFKNARFELHFPGRGGETNIFILLILRRLCVHIVLGLKLFKRHTRRLKPVVEHFFHTVPGEIVTKAHAMG